MVKVITSTELNRNAGAMLKLAESGEAIHITRNGRVVAILTRAKEVEPVRPTITKPVVEADGRHVTTSAKSKPDPDRLRAQTTEPPETNTHTIETVTADVDDWGLPVEHNTEVVMGNKPGAKLSVPNPEPLKPWRKPAGLSKSQQAGGKYER